jgi:hypothetical protein
VPGLIVLSVSTASGINGNTTGPGLAYTTHDGLTFSICSSRIILYPSPFYYVLSGVFFSPNKNYMYFLKIKHDVLKFIYVTWNA